MGLFENMVSLNPLVKHHFPFKWPCLGIPIFLEKAPANVELHWYYLIPSYSLEANWLAPMLTVAKPCFGSWSAVGQPAVTARWGGKKSYARQQAGGAWNLIGPELVTDTFGSCWYLGGGHIQATLMTSIFKLDWTSTGVAHKICAQTIDPK